MAEATLDASWPTVNGWERALSQFDAPGRSALAVSADPRRRVRLGIGHDRPQPGASVLKLALAAACLDAWADGDLDPTAVTRRRELPATRWPTLVDVFDPDHPFTSRELLGIALAASDNVAAEHLRNQLGPARIAASLRRRGCLATEMRAGFGDTHLGPAGRANTTTADDVARLLLGLLADPGAAGILAAMAASRGTPRIQLRLPDETVVHNKTGTLEGVVNDAGIVRAENGPLVMVFLTDQQPDPARTAEDIGTCARALFDAWESDR